MTYTKPQILDSCKAYDCIKGQNKSILTDDSGNQHLVGTPAAYEADE
jgi:hypothetical protein